MLQTIADESVSLHILTPIHLKMRQGLLYLDSKSMSSLSEGNRYMLQCCFIVTILKCS